MPRSVYIHIPFCKSICSYCDFCKIYYYEDIASNYIKALKEEVLSRYKNEEIETLYIGGGTPSNLSMNNTKQLFDIIDVFKIDDLKEFTYEFNVQDIEEEKLKYLKEHKVNRISIGVETINKKGQTLLNRIYSKELIIDKINLAKKYFDNINIDLIYAYKDETLDDIKEDLEFITSFNPKHISTYSLIIEEHTILFNKGFVPIDEELDNKMYYYIRKFLKDLGYNHIEISNFAKEGYRPLHNLVYWNNEEYYGFGAGASGYINDIRYTNTRNVFKYIKNDYKYLEDNLTISDKIENELILGLRKIEGISIKEFKDKYNIDIREVYDIDTLIDKGYLINEDDRLYIPEDKLYVSNSILLNFIGG